MRRVRVFVVILSLLTVFQLEAQRGLELGPWVGGTWYFGDLNNGFDVTHPGPAGGIQARYLFDQRIAISANLSYAQVYGDDRWSKNEWEQNRGLNFRSRIIDFSPKFEFNFMPFEHGHKEYKFTPYIGLGFSIFNFSPSSEYPDPHGVNVRYDKLNDLRTDVTDSLDDGRYSTLAYGANFTFGFKYNIKYRWTVQLFATARWLTTDFLDDVSAQYPEGITPDPLTTLSASDPQIANRVDSDGNPANQYGNAPYSQRGNSSNWDSYNFIGIGITYFFGGLQCPDVQKPRKTKKIKKKKKLK